MKMQGSFTFQAPARRVFDALLDPAILQRCIPGCQAAWWPDEEHMKVRLTLPLPIPGLQGPYDATVRVLEQDAPHTLTLEVGRAGRIGGTVMTVTRLALQDEPTGTRLTYDTLVEISGPIAFLGSPLFQDLIQHNISAFLTNLDSSLTMLSV